jgi:[ribosomal protein S18]-alanine N-acetyltransferase
MDEIIIMPAKYPERQWAARILSESEPWITLGITYERCLKVCHDTGFEMFIAHLEHNPCGVIIMDPRGLAGAPYVKLIAVDPRYRNRQVGAALIGYVENLFRGKARFIFLCVSSFNIRAQKFYASHGFIQVGELKDFIIPGKSELIMQKQL